jgi:SAM-dependent methyltransferase
MSKVWDDRYRSEGYYYGTEPNDYLKAKAPQLSAKANILCLAEGEGRNAAYLASLGHQVTAVDFSEVALEKLKVLAAQKKVHIETVRADLNEFNLGADRWDAIVSIWCHLPSSVRERVHGQIATALRKDGLFILEAYTPRQIPLKTGGPKDPDMLPTKNLLKAELLNLQVLEAHELRREISEGIGHQGTSEVVQFLGKRA